MSEYERIQRETAARKVYDTYWESYANGDLETFASTLDETFEMIGTSETEICHTKADGIDFLKGQVAEVVGKAELKNRKIEVIPVDQLMLVNEHSDIYVLTDSVWNFYSKVRISTVLRETETGWKVVQQHGSLPDIRVHDGETLAIDKISKENLELRDAVKRRTAELEQKNRELEIEAALERVRSRSMAMHHTSELQEVINTVHQQFKGLDISITGGVFIAINEENKHEINCWGAGGTADYVERVHIPILDKPIYAGFIKAINQGPGIYSEEFSYEEKMELFNHLFNHPPYTEAPPKRKKEIMSRQGGYTRSCVVSKNTTIFIINHHGRKFSEEDNQVLNRFGKVFEQSYTRFLDLKKAEEQAREAQIEAALERVRGRAMAIRKSDELQEVITIILKELNHLDFDLMESSIIIFDPPSKDLIVWGTGVANPEFATGKRLQYFEHSFLDGIFHDAEKGVRFRTGFLNKDQLKSYFDKLFTITDFKNQTKQYIEEMYKIEKVFYTQALFKHGFLEVIGLKPVSSEKAEILKRFSKVVDLTYTRFDDIVQAEAQAREAQIEAALEKVRSRSLSMHKSDELKEVVAVLFQKLQELEFGIDKGAALVMTFTPDSKDHTQWITDAAQTYAIPFFIPFTEHSIALDQISARKKGLAFFSKLYAKKEKNEYFKFLFQNTEYRQVPGEVQEMILNSKNFGISIAFEKHSAIAIPSSIGKLVTGDEINILKRFARVFEQTYTRFLDLQKAEAQAREAQIEAALEKVRSASLAMHHSDELEKVVMAVSERLSELGFQSDGSLIFIFDSEKRNIILWIASSHFPAPLKIHLPFDSVMENNPIWKTLWHVFDTGEHTMNKTFSGKEKDDYFRYVQKNNTETILIMEKESKLELPDWTVSLAAEKNAILSVDTWSDKVITPDEFQILIRFAKVFQQAYTRFLDLQKAEAQAREAQIEAALERVRSKAMAMHNSEDLNATIAAFYRELEQFSITPRRCGVGLLQKNRIAELSTMNTMEHGNSIEIIGILKMEGHWVLNGVYDNWILQNEFHPVLRGNEIKEYNQLIRPQVAFPEYENNSVQFGYFFFFPEGGVYAWTEKEMKEDELNIYRRFTKVLSLTYKRYKDLKDAEASALEAERRASLDRVRAEIASMRSADDLKRITPIIWHELTSLGVPFVRCGVFIIDEATEHIQVHLSTPNGNALGALDLPFNSSELTLNSVNHWRQGIIFKTHWNKQEFLNFMQSMIKLGQISNPETYQGATQPPESLHLHFVPFKQGMLYAGNTAPLDKEALDLVKALAESFSIAYARYEDFKQLQTAKNQIEKTFTELKAAQNQLIQAEKMASLGELTAGIAHEIQNPLNFVNNFSELSNELIAEIDEERAKNPESRDENLVSEFLSDIKQNLKKINHHGKRAADIVKGMLHHSRTGSGQKELTNINALADEYLRLAYHGLKAKDKSFNAEFKTEFDPNLPKINVVPQDIGRVLLNLINNAFYAVQAPRPSRSESGTSSEGGFKDPNYIHKPLVIVKTSFLPPSGGTTRPDDPVGKGGALISVYDNGPGIPDSIKDKIFQPFFTTKPTGQGTGLGLSLSYDIVKAHGGELKVETKPARAGVDVEGEGTEFTVILPL